MVFDRSPINKDDSGRGGLFIRITGCEDAYLKGNSLFL